MEISIISGKGGTGKSSISAGFATLSSDVVLADCDVDASNQHILFKPKHEEEQVFTGGQKAVIDPEICTNCGICVPYCRFDAISFSDNGVIISETLCDGCHLCKRLCPHQAIKMVNYNKSRMYTGSFRNGRMVYGQLAPGEENSGKLVNMVRDKAKKQAKLHNIDTIIIDGPPGIGCPVISSITGTDHLLIVTEPSLSGLIDLARAAEVSQSFGIKTSVLINKFDLDQNLTNDIEKWCYEHQLEIVGFIPFDTMIVEAMVNCKSIIEWSPDSAASIAIRDAYNNILNEKPTKMEVILTGRYAPKVLIKSADLVTEMKEIKHYITKEYKPVRALNFNPKYPKIMNTKDKGFNTKLIHAGAFDDEFGSATVPIYQTSTFKFKSAQHGADCFSGKSDGYIYTRIGNPTIRAFEKNIAELENGYDGIATSSGMAAITSVYMALLGAGSHIVSSDAVYGPARGVLEQDFSRFNVEATFVNTSKIENIVSALKPNTKVLYIETPANPTMEITDLKACSEIAREKGLILVVDNTFSSPFLQKPLDLGADVVLHSITKFINGHADIVGGVIVAKDPGLYKKIRHSMVYMGCNMDPTQAFMVIRGVKTLALRIDRAQQNAAKIADYLQNHPKVSWIKYPGLSSHPQHELAKTQMTGFGSMMSFGLKGGYEAGRNLMDNVHLAILAVSLGGVETLIQHPASMTHAGVSHEHKLAAGITDDLVRFSVGIEDVDDIIADLDQALKNI